MNPKDYSIENIWRFDAERFVNSYEVALFCYTLYNFKEPIIDYKEQKEELEAEYTDHLDVFDKKKIFNRIEYEVDFIAEMNSYLREGNMAEAEVESHNIAFIIVYLQKKASDLAIQADALLINDEKKDIHSKLKDVSNISEENKKHLDILKSTVDQVEPLKANAKHKIVYLNELGIIDFLTNNQPFSTSVNSLAVVLSTILGENTTTIQSYLNPLINKDTSSHNHPYSSEKAVDKIKDSLNKIGFKK